MDPRTGSRLSPSTHRLDKPGADLVQPAWRHGRAVAAASPVVPTRHVPSVARPTLPVHRITPFELASA
jgi:hypothetical protein